MKPSQKSLTPREGEGEAVEKAERLCYRYSLNVLAHYPGLELDEVVQRMRVTALRAYRNYDEVSARSSWNTYLQRSLQNESRDIKDHQAHTMIVYSLDQQTINDDGEYEEPVWLGREDQQMETNVMVGRMKDRLTQVEKSCLDCMMEGYQLRECKLLFGDAVVMKVQGVAREEF
jgi:DNA-directed RNA polymerase specialized sigma24 family protein